MKWGASAPARGPDDSGQLRSTWGRKLPPCEKHFCTPASKEGKEREREGKGRKRERKGKGKGKEKRREKHRTWFIKHCYSYLLKMSILKVFKIKTS